MQQRFDEEDKLLRIQREEFASQIQSASARQFLCSICLEEYSEENIVRLEFCDHALCRTCTKDYVSSKLEEHRFPILCPMCMADDHKGNPGTITDITVQQSGITNQQFDIWVELQMSQFSVLVHCRKCKGSAYVDRQDLEDTTLLPCPLPDCNYIWCKACQQSVVIGGAKHSCDGSSELDHLMKQRGWKYCPSCKTPIQKEMGCNHMTCMSPGCNTHFCYLCGGAIITSALRRDIQAAISAHYARCRLFEEVADRALLP
ncbi:hypothetical protein SERLA73DRAFT_115609 [Serpula lacrymans var. lacrymans S7.3]|uniref:RBR-type E3 ubiquitin transferase n=1 Tax=Serpula lacrymans var. lacrymans (strain S7.3) TaxID=936435 RepID=F8QDC5_SERL3|nr:hypothetical protein SERLA73DRAFT_115609 [Serpula lacrymans var. lacrymans S7.3]